MQKIGNLDLGEMWQKYIFVGQKKIFYLHICTAIKRTFVKQIKFIALINTLEVDYFCANKIEKKLEKSII